MSSDAIDLSDNSDDLRSMMAALQEQLAASKQALEAERAAYQATSSRLNAANNGLQLTALQIEKLKVQIARLRRMKFGQSFEKLTLQADQLELTLEDMEAEHAHALSVVENNEGAETPARARRKPKRSPLPDHLPRDEVIHPAPDADGCSVCGGAMAKLGEDVTEVLDYVPGRFRVVRHVRPKLACGCCDAITQAEAPALPIPRGRASAGLLAHVVVSKFADHLPLYRQSEIYRREGVDLSRSTLADWLGQVRPGGCPTSNSSTRLNEV
jgi:transposase